MLIFQFLSEVWILCKLLSLASIWMPTAWSRYPERANGTSSPFSLWMSPAVKPSLQGLSRNTSNTPTAVAAPEGLTSTTHSSGSPWGWPSWPPMQKRWFCLGAHALPGSTPSDSEQDEKLQPCIPTLDRGWNA